MVMDLDLLYYTIIFLISAILARTIFFSMTQTRKRLPPSPIGLPIIGHLHLLSNFPYRSFHKLSTRYGPLIHLCLGSLPCIVASSPEVVKELLVTNDATFAARPVNIAINNLTYNSSGFSFTPDGPYWKFMKKVSMSQLLGGRTLTQLQPIRRDEICQLVQLLVNKSNACETVNLSEEFMKLSNNTISRMMLGIKCTGADDQTKEIRTLVREVTEIFGQFNLSDFLWFLRNLDLQGLKKRSLDVHRRYNDFLEAIIKEREQSRKDSKKMGDDNGVMDFLDILHNISEDENTEIRVTRDNIKAFMLVSSFHHLLTTKSLMFSDKFLAAVKISVTKTQVFHLTNAAPYVPNHFSVEKFPKSFSRENYRFVSKLNVSLCSLCIFSSNGETNDENLLKTNVSLCSLHIFSSNGENLLKTIVSLCIFFSNGEINGEILLNIFFLSILMAEIDLLLLTDIKHGYSVQLAKDEA